ncbi:MAG TPA: hypothetical protein VFS47_04335, partial [Steroidobacteraceae bacterium]|nr:hypothetical protein [Steroidobacteraceae bacterium]
MKTPILMVVLLSGILVPGFAHADPFCALLRKFVNSVEPGEKREFTFHTLWGGDFKDSHEDDDVIYAKRCIHNNYAPAKAVCDYLMEHGAVEFAGNNVKDAVRCLSPKTDFAPQFVLHLASFSFSVGSENRG